MANEMVRHIEQEAALADAKKKVNQLKEQFVLLVQRPTTEQAGLTEVIQDLKESIGDRLPIATMWNNPDTLSAWLRIDHTAPENVDPESKLGKLLQISKESKVGELQEARVQLSQKFNEANRAIQIAKNADAQTDIDAAKNALATLVGQNNVEAVLNGEMRLQDPTIEGEIGKLAQLVIELSSNQETAPETEKKGPRARFGEFVRGIFAEVGKLKANIQEKWNATEGNWFDKAKGMFKREKQQESGETANEQELNEFQKLMRNFKENGGKFRHEMTRQIHDILARGGKEALQLKELISTNKDLRDQLAFLGVNIVANFFHLNPIGFAFGGIGKVFLDERALARAQEEGTVDELIKRRMFQSTDSKGYAERKATAETAEDVAEYQKLKTEVGAKHEAAVMKRRELQEKIKHTKKKLRNTRLHKDQRTTLKENLNKDTEMLGQLDQEIATIEGNPDFLKLVALSEKLTQTVATEKELSAMDQAGKFLFKALRLAGQGAGTYAGIAKKMLVGLQSSGNDVESFISRNVGKEQSKNVEAIVAKVRELTAGLTVDKIKERSKAGRKERAQLKKDALQIRDLISSLTDLGMFDDIIPRNIGHKQINAFFGRTEIEENKLIRDPQLLAELRTKVMEAVKPMAAALGGKEMDWQSIDGGLHELLSDINYIGAQNEAWVRDRQIEMSRRMTTADIIGIFANGALVYAGTHAGELTDGMKKIIGDFNHEQQLAGNQGTMAEAIQDHSRGNINETNPNGGHTDGPTSEGTGSRGGTGVTETSSPSSGSESDSLNPNGTTENASPNGTSASVNNTTETATSLRLDNETTVQYADTDGIIHIDKNTNVIGHLPDGTETTDGGASFLITPDNPNGTWGGRLLADAANAGVQMDVNSETAFLYNYLLPLSREMGRNFTAQELLQIDALGDQGLTWQQIALQMFNRNVQ